MSVAKGFSGVIERMNALGRGRSQPDTYVGDSRPSVQLSSQRMRISDKAALTNRVSGCALVALCTDVEKGRWKCELTLSGQA